MGHILLPWENSTAITVPKADIAMKTDMIRSAFAPKTIRKNDAARIRPESTISSFGTAAKYATFTRMYKTDTDKTASGAAIDRV